MESITSLQDLCEFYYVPHDDPDLLRGRFFKYTDCGAWITLITSDGATHSEHFNDLSDVVGFQVGTIIEGSEADIVGPRWLFPVSPKEFGEFMDGMELEAEVLWREANEVNLEEEE